LDWAEVWLLFIPLSILLFFKLDYKRIEPIQIYFIIALFLNLAIDITWKYREAFLERGWDWSLVRDNNLLYNLQSVTRVVLFTIFLSQFLSSRYKKILKWSLIIYSSALLLNFVFFESPLNFSSRIFSAESLFLLTVCILYFFSILNNDQIFSYREQPAFWIAIGLSLYEASNFSIFLFYTILISKAKNFAFIIWDVHNIFYAVLCIFSAKAFYQSRR
jgi:hypothetical protein